MRDPARNVHFPVEHRPRVPIVRFAHFAHEIPLHSSINTVKISIYESYYESCNMTPYGIKFYDGSNYNSDLVLFWMVFFDGGEFSGRVAPSDGVKVRSDCAQVEKGAFLVQTGHSEPAVVPRVIPEHRVDRRLSFGVVIALKRIEANSKFGPIKFATCPPTTKRKFPMTAIPCW